MEITHFGQEKVKRTSTFIDPEMISSSTFKSASMTSSNQSAQSIQSNEKTREQKLEEIVNRFNDTETLRRDLSADRRYSKGSKGISSKDTSSYNESSEDESDQEEFVIEDSPGNMILC